MKCPKDYTVATRAAYDKNASAYAEWSASRFLNPESSYFMGSIGYKGNVLDAGCGAGRDCDLFKHYGLLPTGIDLSEKMIQIAKQQHPTVPFSVMDVCRLEFTDAFFSGVWSVATLHHLNDEDAYSALREFNRTLQSNGLLFLMVKSGSVTGELQDSEIFNDARFFNFFEADRLKLMLAEAGFKQPHLYRRGEQSRFGYQSRDIMWLHAFARKG